MKKFKIFPSFILLLLFFAFNAHAQEEDLNVSIDVEQDADFSDYNSYFWVTDFGNGENVWITVNRIQGEMIKDAVEYEMDVLGMEWKPENPDLLVNFHIFDEKYDENFYVGSAPYEYRYMDKQAIMEDITDGTIVISFIDTNTGKSIWEGYATIGVNENEPLREQQADIRQATSAIMDRFNPEGLNETTTLR